MQAQIEALFANPPAPYTAADFLSFAEFKAALNAGRIRCGGA